MISVLRDSHDCVGFLRSAGPRGFQAYDAGQLLGLFQDKQRRSKRLRPQIRQETQMETNALKPPEYKRNERGQFDRPGKTLSKTAKKTGLTVKNNKEQHRGFKKGQSGNPAGRT